MSHLSQAVAEALANGRVGDGVVMHQPERDRVSLNHEGQTYYVVLLTEEEMMAVTDGFSPLNDGRYDRLAERFVV